MLGKAILLAALAAAPAHGQEAFNLRCKGTIERAIGTSSPFSFEAEEVFRIDMAARRWCRRDCGEVRRIHSIEDETITLASSSDYDPENSYSERITINRRTGVLRERWENRTLGSRERRNFRAECEREPFGSFPRRF